MSQQPAAEYIGSYKLGKALGSGSFCQVRLGTHVPTGRKVAIKVMSRRKLKKQNMLEKVRSEIHILRMFTHPHIIRILEVIDTPSDICIVMEHVNGGELFNYIVSRGRLTEPEARTFTQQLVSALAYCHAHAVVHRDLKPENLLLAIREDESGQSSSSTPLLKLADFGLSTLMRDGVFLKTSCGSPNYAAPEVISASPYAGPEIDVWSCGVILYACLCGTLPFDHENIRILFKKIKAGQFEIPGFVSAPARDLLQRMLVVDPLRRITIQEITKHPWFRVDLPIYLWLSAYEFEKEAQSVDMAAVNLMCEQYGYTTNAVLNAIRMGPELTTSRKNGNKHNLRQLAIIYKLTSEDNSLNRYSELAVRKMERIAHVLGASTNDPEVFELAMTGDEEDKSVIRDLETMRLRFKTPLLTVPGRWYAGHWVTSDPYITVTALLMALQAQGYQWRMLGPYSIRCVLYAPKKSRRNIGLNMVSGEGENADNTDGFEDGSMKSAEFGKSELKNELSQHRPEETQLDHTLSATDNLENRSNDRESGFSSKEVLLKLSIVIYSTHRGHSIIDVRRAGGHHVVFLQNVHHLLHEFRSTLYHMTQQQQQQQASASAAQQTEMQQMQYQQQLQQQMMQQQAMQGQAVAGQQAMLSAAPVSAQASGASTVESAAAHGAAAAAAGQAPSAGAAAGVPASMADIPLLDVPTLTLASSFGLSEAHLRFIHQYLVHLQIPATVLSVGQVVRVLAEMDVNTRAKLFSDAAYLGEYLTLLGRQSLQQQQQQQMAQQGQAAAAMNAQTAIATNPVAAAATTAPAAQQDRPAATAAAAEAPSVDPTMLLTDLPPDQLLRYYQQCHALYVRHYERYGALVQARERGEEVDVALLRSLHDQLQQQANALTHMRQLPNMPKG